MEFFTLIMIVLITTTKSKVILWDTSNIRARHPPKYTHLHTTAAGDSFTQN
jgi:hypothetical protein